MHSAACEAVNRCQIKHKAVDAYKSPKKLTQGIKETKISARYISGWYANRSRRGKGRY